MCEAPIHDTRRPVLQIVRDLRRSARGVQILLAAMLLLGTGQQIFVVTRNPFLLEIGFRAESIPAVQSAGAIAGVMSGLAGLAFAPRLTPRVLFIVCAAAQALGFGVQATATGARSVFVGAAIAGFGIQLATTVTPPILKALTTPEERVSVFAGNALMISPLSGLLAALVITLLVVAVGRDVHGQRCVLAAGVVASVAAATLFARVPAAHAIRTVAGWSSPRIIAVCVAFLGLLAFGGGITLPFLQLYFKTTFGLSMDRIAWVYAASMAFGVVGYAAAPVMVRRFGLVRTVVVLQLMALPLFVELARTTSVTFAALAFLARHTLMSVAMPLLQAFYQEVAHGSDGHTIASLGMVTSSVTWAGGALLAGPLLARAGGRFDVAITVTAVTYGVGALAAAAVFPRLWLRRSRA